MLRPFLPLNSAGSKSAADNPLKVLYSLPLSSIEAACRSQSVAYLLLYSKYNADKDARGNAPPLPCYPLLASDQHILKIGFTDRAKSSRLGL